MFRVIHSESDQSVVRVPIDPSTGSPVLLDGSVSVSFFDKRENESGQQIGTATVTQDATNVVVTSDAGYQQAEPDKICINPNAVQKGHFYLIEGGGHSELFQVRDTSVTEVFSIYGLRHNYCSKDLVRVRGVELIAAFPDLSAEPGAVKNGGGPYLVTWSYVLDGSTVVVADTAFLDRYSLAPIIDEAYVLMANPTLHERSRGRTRVSQAIAVAWQDYLAEVEAAGRDPSLFMPSNAAKVAVRHAALSYLFEWVSGGEADDEAARMHREKFSDGMRNILMGQPPKGTVQIDRETDQAKTVQSGFELLRRS